MSSAVDAVAAIEAATTTRETLEVVSAKTHQSRFSIGNYHRHHYQVSLPIKTHCTTYSVREVKRDESFPEASEKFLRPVG